MSCAKPFLNYLPPVFLLFLIGWLYYSYLVEFCLNYIQSPAKRYSYLVVIHILLLMFAWSYLQAWCTKGDDIPSEYKMSPMDHIKLSGYDEDTMNLVLHKLIQVRRLEVYTRTDLTRIRYCSKCMQIKPDRTHHCSSCQACILKMDHHCPWIANCVSFNNQKQFILMLFYGTLLCIFYSGTMLEYVIRYWQDAQIQYEKLHLTIGFVVATSCALLVIMLFIYNLNMSFRNETTLESLREPIFANPNLTFNLGRCNNFVQVFGEDACMWLVPIHTSLGNGYEFPVKNATGF